MKLGAAVRLTVERKQASNRRAEYVASLRQYLNQFARGREDLRIAAITPGDIEDWFQQRQEKPATRASNLGRLSAMFSYCWRHGHIEQNPCDRVERVSIEREPPQILSVSQCRTLLDFTRQYHPRALAYLALCLFAGVRPAEAQRLRASAVDLSRGTVTVDAAASKVRRRRIVHLLPAGVAWLRVAALDSLPVGTRIVRMWRRAARERLGLSSWPSDVLRHSSASYWIAEVQDAGKVAHELGNSAGVLLRDYRALVTREEAKAFWDLRPVDGQQLEFRL